MPWSYLIKRLRRPMSADFWGTRPGFLNLAGYTSGSFSFFLRIWILLRLERRRWSEARFLTCSVTAYWLGRRFSANFFDRENETGFLLLTALPCSYVEPVLTSLMRRNVSLTSLKCSYCNRVGSIFFISRVRIVLPTERPRRFLLNLLSWAKSVLPFTTFEMWACGGLFYSATIELAYLTA